jgi:signal recognition particle subunit SEC65
MYKKINLSNTVYELCTEYPEIADILKDLGFHDIVKPGMLQTAGRFMTIPKGAAMKKISLDRIIETLTEHDFYIMEDSK